MEPLQEIKEIIIHHSGKQHHSIENIRTIHVTINGWDDIGYHYIIGNGVSTKDGVIYKGRDIQFVGAHVKGHNTNSIGICLIGDFDNFTPTEKQLITVQKLIQKLMRLHHLEIKNVLCHREFEGVTKTCPGTLFDMNVFRNQLTLTKKSLYKL